MKFTQMLNKYNEDITFPLVKQMLKTSRGTTNNDQSDQILQNILLILFCKASFCAFQIREIDTVYVEICRLVFLQSRSCVESGTTD